MLSERSSVKRSARRKRARFLVPRLFSSTSHSLALFSAICSSHFCFLFFFQDRHISIPLFSPSFILPEGWVTDWHRNTTPHPEPCTHTPSVTSSSSHHRSLCYAWSKEVTPHRCAGRTRKARENHGALTWNGITWNKRLLLSYISTRFTMMVDG